MDTNKSQTLAAGLVQTAPKVIFGFALIASASAIAQASTTYSQGGRSLAVEKTEQTKTTRIGDLTNISPERVWMEKLDAEGRTVEVDGPRIDIEDRTRIEWSNESKSKTIINALGHETRFDFDAFGRLVRHTDSNGVQTEMSYTEDGRLNGVLNWSNTSVAQHTMMKWSEDGELNEVVLPSGRTITDPYSDNGKLTAEVKSIFDEISRWMNNAHLRNDLPHIDKPQTEWFVEKLSSMLKLNADTNDAGKITGGVDSTGNQVSFSYDSSGYLNSFTDGRGVETRFTHNGFGEVVREVTNERGVTRNTYDEAGNLTRQVREGGLVINRSYDALNRVIRIVYKEHGIDRKVHRFTYDDCEYGVGRLCRINSDGIVTRFAYTPPGNLARETVSFNDGRTEVSKYAYTTSGQLRVITYPTGLKVRYHHDEAGFVRRVTGQYETNAESESFIIANNVKFNPNTGQLDQLTFGNGLKTKWTYEDSGRLKTHSVLDNGTPIARSRYRFDDRGNITAINRLDASASQRFDYDAMDRLVSEERPQNVDTPLMRAYSYDGAGNRLSRTAGGQTQNYSYASEANRLDTLGRKAISYDDRGNLLWDRQGKRSFTYDVTNRMEAFYKNGDLKASYRYNAAGQRISKTLHGLSEDRDDYQTLLFSYSPNGWLLSEHGQRSDRSNSFSRDYVWLGDRPLAQIERRLNADGITRTSRLTYLHTDHLNTPEWGSDDSGNAVWRWDRDAFGAESTDRDPDGDGTKITIRLRFPGQYADRDSGLFYNHHRDYDPKLGRYIQSDPIGLFGGVNRYAYVSGNPVNLVDPNGLEERCVSTDHGYGSSTNNGGGYQRDGTPYGSGQRGAPIVTETCIQIPDTNPPPTGDTNSTNSGNTTNTNGTPNGTTQTEEEPEEEQNLCTRGGKKFEGGLDPDLPVFQVSGDMVTVSFSDSWLRRFFNGTPHGFGPYSSFDGVVRAAGVYAIGQVISQPAVGGGIRIFLGDDGYYYQYPPEYPAGGLAHHRFDTRTYTSQIATVDFGSSIFAGRFYVQTVLCGDGNTCGIICDIKAR